MSAFDTQVAAFLAETFEESPTRASSLGLAEFEHRLDGRSLDALEAARDLTDRWHAIFNAVDPSMLTPDERLDRDLIVTDLGARRALRDREGYKSNPVGYVQLGFGAVAGMFERRLLPEAELTDAALSRLSAIPDVLAACREVFDPVAGVELHVKRAIGVCANAERYFRSTLPREVKDPARQERLAVAGAGVADEYAACGAFLRSVVGAGTGEWALGAERYGTLLRLRHRIDMDTDEVYALGLEGLEVETSDLASARAEHGLTAREALGTVPPFETAGARLEYLSQRVAAARQFVADHGLVTLPPAERCEVRGIPPHRSLIASFAYHAAPPLGEPRAGWFEVPDPGPGAPAGAYGRPLGLDSTVAHETYPGHHVHAARDAGNRPVRYLIRSPFFSEGWGLHSERMMYEAGFFQDSFEVLAFHQDRQRRAARIVLDVGLHTGRFTPEEAEQYFRQRCGVSEALAKREIHRYRANPIQAIAYYLGADQIGRMMRGATAAGKSPLEFNDRFTTLGAPPLALAEQLLREEGTVI